MMSADPELGIVYLPTEAPTNDFYGGHRPGDNLFTQSVVALNAQTGERVWHFQMIHHGIWDYDTPAAPNLIDITVDGREIKALAQVTKQGFTYVFDRVTGVPVWPIIERPVPQEPFIPGERLSPTQPVPTKPPAFALQGLTEDDVVDFTPEIRAQAMAILENYSYGPLFTPTSISEGDYRGTILLPGAGGGANWSGAGIDPETATLFVPSSNNPTVPIMVNLESESNFNYFRLSNSGVPGPRGLPILKPPYSTITAYDMNSGEILWQVPNGDGATRIESNPLVEGVELPPLGGGGRYPVLVTGSLLIHAQNIGTGPRLLARDKATGAEVAAIDLPANPGGAAMSYAVEGKQYIAMPLLTTPVPELLVLSLPD
jgi:quinoprotein glucose dehydrogenase